MAQNVSLDELVTKLCAAFDHRPEDDVILQLLADHPVDPQTVEPYLDYRDDKYTRSLVHRDARFEIIVLSWEVGQVSRIHNHCGQSCWMAAAVGTLQVVNYRVAEGDPEGGHCRLEAVSEEWLTQERPGMVDLSAPIHSVGNPAQVGDRAASVHVYSLPYDYCMVYDLAEQLARRVELSFDNTHSLPLA